MRLGILASGGLGFYVLQDLVESHEVIFAMTDKATQDIISFCKSEGIPCFQGNPRKGACETFIQDKAVDILISVNYLFLIEKELINLPGKMAFNIHGSLLPKYRGRTPHVWAIINNEKEAGITAHVIDEGCDTGDVLAQKSIPIETNDTGSDILKKYEQAYLPLIESVLNSLEEGNVKRISQDDSKATYFGKRTPDDGHINWHWQRERIFNWVRAQAHPYPGAFTYYQGEKITIDAIEFDNYGYSYDESDGKILSLNPIRVKTPNGVVLLKTLRHCEVKMSVGEVLK